jgi:hypothetical protein
MTSKEIPQRNIEELPCRVNVTDDTAHAHECILTFNRNWIDLKAITKLKSIPS